eukprot:gnl/Chilomastix_cuspidata/2445.p1 GENE.gnl/Chilomastix_cuspidata/2445~~gnl/Chilomastix_cuspidata/2445.p1  ORF type:complete len:1440 (+),score=199.40 gnl/Chilomastix_cuspidata/2445:45-4322(+)
MSSARLTHFTAFLEPILALGPSDPLLFTSNEERSALILEHSSQFQIIVTHLKFSSFHSLKVKEKPFDIVIVGRSLYVSFFGRVAEYTVRQDTLVEVQSYNTLVPFTKLFGVRNSVFSAYDSSLFLLGATGFSRLMDLPPLSYPFVFGDDFFFLSWDGSVSRLVFGAPTASGAAPSCALREAHLLAVGSPSPTGLGAWPPMCATFWGDAVIFLGPNGRPESAAGPLLPEALRKKKFDFVQSAGSVCVLGGQDGWFAFGAAGLEELTRFSAAFQGGQSFFLTQKTPDALVPHVPALRLPAALRQTGQTVLYKFSPEQPVHRFAVPSVNVSPSEYESFLQWRGRDGENALHVAVLNRHRSFVEQFSCTPLAHEKDYAGFFPAHVAASLGNLYFLIKLLCRGRNDRRVLTPELSFIQRMSRVPLEYLAAFSCSVECIRFFEFLAAHEGYRLSRKDLLTIAVVGSCTSHRNPSEALTCLLGDSRNYSTSMDGVTFLHAAALVAPLSVLHTLRHSHESLFLKALLTPDSNHMTPIQVAISVHRGKEIVDYFREQYTHFDEFPPSHNIILSGSGNCCLNLERIPAQYSLGVNSPLAVFSDDPRIWRPSHTPCSAPKKIHVSIEEEYEQLVRNSRDTITTLSMSSTLLEGAGFAWLLCGNIAYVFHKELRGSVGVVFFNSTKFAAFAVNNEVWAIERYLWNIKFKKTWECIRYNSQTMEVLGDSRLCFQEPVACPSLMDTLGHTMVIEIGGCLFFLEKQDKQNDTTLVFTEISHQNLFEQPCVSMRILNKPSRVESQTKAAPTVALHGGRNQRTLLITNISLYEPLKFNKVKFFTAAREKKKGFLWIANEMGDIFLYDKNFQLVKAAPCPFRHKGNVRLLTIVNSDGFLWALFLERHAYWVVYDFNGCVLSIEQTSAPLLEPPTSAAFFCSSDNGPMLFLTFASSLQHRASELGKTRLQTQNEESLAFVTSAIRRESSSRPASHLYVALTSGDSDFHSCLRKNTEIFQYGVDINSVNYYNETPLLFACSNNSYEVAETFLKRGANPNTQSVNFFSPMLVAILLRASKLIKLLLEHNASLNFGEQYLNVFHLFAWKPELQPFAAEFIQIIIETGSFARNSINITNYENKTPLNVAIETKSYEYAKILIQNNAIANIGNPPVLHVLSASAPSSFFSFFIEGGTNLYIRSTLSQNTILHTALEANNVSNIRFIYKRRPKVFANLCHMLNDERDYPLHVALKHNDAESIQMILEVLKENDFSITEEPNKYCLTPLQVGARFGSADGVRCLCENGVNVNKPDIFTGETALHAASSFGYVEIIDCLLDFGANLLATNNYGLTPLCVSRESSLKALLQRIDESHGEKENWLSQELVPNCPQCHMTLSEFHNCRFCGRVVCKKCCKKCDILRFSRFRVPVCVQCRKFPELLSGGAPGAGSH